VRADAQLCSTRDGGYPGADFDVRASS
jgi:hypothetical protein